MSGKLELTHSPNILPNHIQVTSSLHHRIDKTFPLFGVIRIVARKCLRVSGKVWVRGYTPCRVSSTVLPANPQDNILVSNALVCTHS